MNELETELDLEGEVSSFLDDDSDDGAEPQVYEVGYHIVPTVEEGKLEGEVSKITDLLKGLGAEFVGERFPSEINLAYTIEKKIDGVLGKFDTAYFGWVAFELPPSNITKVKEALDSNLNVLRFLIIKTSKDAVAATMADPGLDVGAPKEEVEAVLDEENVEDVEKEEEEA